MRMHYPRLQMFRHLQLSGLLNVQIHHYHCYCLQSQYQFSSESLEVSSYILNCYWKSCSLLQTLPFRQVPPTPPHKLQESTPPPGWTHGTSILQQCWHFVSGIAGLLIPLQSLPEGLIIFCAEFAISMH